ncbi:MAG: hypothetical protein LQ348_003653 [Seirophora lacunosa]|nr:MAG: hypothetical protein LQ344_005914 [Seirophora lacunosa]KAI4190453.1 MAG: hypothetical protein LQ348_003653 [Seirophora lacunosa]
MPRIEDANSLPLADYGARFLPTSFAIGLSSHPSLRIKLESSSTISAQEFEDCFNLIASSSASTYAASSIGWSPTKKRKEMKLPDLRYLLVVGSTSHSAVSSVEGFLSSMMTYEDGHEVVYCYELHLAPSLQRRGIGKHLMSLIEHAGSSAGVEKSMLTVFVRNDAALRFYQKLGYTRDDYSPEPRTMRNGRSKMPTYTILSKSLQQWATDEEDEQNG